jgi:hypothetical protein
VKYQYFFKISDAYQPHTTEVKNMLFIRQEVPCLLASKQRRTSIEFFASEAGNARARMNKTTLELDAAAPELKFIPVCNYWHRVARRV